MENCLKEDSTATVFIKNGPIFRKQDIHNVFNSIIFKSDATGKLPLEIWYTKRYTIKN